MPVKVSVIIPVRDRRDLLAEALAALDAQTFRDFEVMVVDDGSTDGTLELAQASTVAGRPVRVLINPGRGAVEARQFACDESTAPYLAFTDSDCRPLPRWLEALVEVMDAGADLAAGPTQPARPPKPLERSMASSGEDGGYPTCNVMYRRASFENVGGFGERATLLKVPSSSLARHYGFWEDTLMAWRLRRSGAVSAFAPEAIVEHHVFPPDLGDLFRRTWMLGANATLMKTVPELRATLLANGFFFQNRARALVYVMAAALAVGQPRVALVALALWVAAKIRRHRRGQVGLGDIIVALPVELAAETVLSAALVRGSIVARTIVL